MNRILLIAAAVFAARLCAADKTLTVIATIPDLADIAREIGGAHVSVESMASGQEDPHAVPVRPALAAKLARTDVLIEVGLDLEHAFLPALVDASNNPRIKLGSQAHIIASDGIVPKEVPPVVSRTEGEQHPQGNPHVNLGPDNGKRMAKNIAAGFSALAPGNETDFKNNLKTYLAKLAEKEKEWKTKGAKLKGVKYVSFHPDFIYFADYFGMEQVGTLEPKPGIPPSAAHTADIIKKLTEIKGTKVIVREPQYSENLPNQIAAQTGAKVVKVAIMVNGLPEAKTWIEMIDANLNALLKAVE